MKDGEETCSPAALGWGIHRTQPGAAGLQETCVRQAQWAADGHGRPSPRPEALTLPPGMGQFCQTNPNWRGLMRVTSAFEEKGYGNLRRSRGGKEQSQTWGAWGVWVRASRAGRF